MCYEMLVQAGEKAGQMMDAHDAAGATRASGVRQAGIQGQADQRIKALIDKTTASNPDAGRGVAGNDFMAALRNANTQNDTTSFSAVPGASKQYAADVVGARADAGASNAATASRMAAIDAPIYQRRNEATNFNRASTDLSGLDARSRTEAYLSHLRTSGIMGGAGG